MVNDLQKRIQWQLNLDFEIPIGVLCEHRSIIILKSVRSEYSVFSGLFNYSTTFEVERYCSTIKTIKCTIVMHVYMLIKKLFSFTRWSRLYSYSITNVLSKFFLTIFVLYLCTFLSIFFFFHSANSYLYIERDCENITPALLRNYCVWEICNEIVNKCIIYRLGKC